MKITTKLYNWMMDNLPQRWMYTRTWIDNKSYIWSPRFGYSQKQKDYAEKRSKELLENIKFDE